MTSRILDPEWVELFKSQVNDDYGKIGPKGVSHTGNSLAKGTILKLVKEEEGEEDYIIDSASFLGMESRQKPIYKWMLTTHKDGPRGPREHIYFELIYNKTNDEVNIEEVDPKSQGTGGRKTNW